MRSCLILLLLVFLSSCVPKQNVSTIPTKPYNHSGFEGVWKGQGSQDSTTFWSIKIRIGPKGYYIDYPSVNCGGKLILLHRSAKRIEFRENMTYGRNKCINHGRTVLLKDGPNHAQFQWYYTNGKKGAKGSVTRKTQ